MRKLSASLGLDAGSIVNAMELKPDEAIARTRDKRWRATKARQKECLAKLDHVILFCI